MDAWDGGTCDPGTSCVPCEAWAEAGDGKRRCNWTPRASCGTDCGGDDGADSGRTSWAEAGSGHTWAAMDRSADDLLVVAGS